MTERLTFADGTELENSNALVAGALFLYLRGTDLRRAFGILIEPENTNSIVYTMMNGDTVLFTGYTKLIAVRDEGDGLISALLQREAA